VPGLGGVGGVVPELLLPAVARFARHGHVLISERRLADGALVATAGAGPAAGHRWEDQIAAAVLTGITAATFQSLNRIAKLKARLACGFRNPANQHRRVRIACTRGYRRQSRTATSRSTRSVIGRKPDLGYSSSNFEDP
jgi:hypothetical protein